MGYSFCCCSEAGKGRESRWAEVSIENRRGRLIREGGEGVGRAQQPGGCLYGGGDIFSGGLTSPKQNACISEAACSFAGWITSCRVTLGPVSSGQSSIEVTLTMQLQRFSLGSNKLSGLFHQYLKPVKPRSRCAFEGRHQERAKMHMKKMLFARVATI